MNEQIDRLLEDRRMQIGAVGLVAGVLLFTLVQMYGKAYRPRRYDFYTYLVSARALLDGAHPYLAYKTETIFAYVYPLFLAFVAIPLAVMPYWLANFIWYALSAASLILAGLLLLKIAEKDIGTSLGRHLAVPGCAIFLFLFSPIQNNLLNGQVNAIVLLCCVLFLHSFSRGRSVPGAIWLAVAISIKLLPAILLLFLLRRRAYRVVVWTVLFTVILCLLPAVVTGAQIFTYYADYADSFLRTRLTTGGDSRVDGRTFFTLERTVEYFLPWTATSTWIRVLSQLVTVGALLAVDLAGRRSSRPRRDIWPFCAYLLGALFLSPLSETHHLVLAVPAVLLIGVKALFDERWATAPIKALIACFAVCFLVVAQTLDTTPFYFVSLVMLLALVFLAMKPPGAVGSTAAA